MVPGNFDWFLHTMIFFYHTRYILKKQQNKRENVGINDDESDEDKEPEVEAWCKVIALVDYQIFVYIGIISYNININGLWIKIEAGHVIDSRSTLQMKGSAWNVSGICLECAWNLPGICLEWTRNGPGMWWEYGGNGLEYAWNGAKNKLLFLTWIPPGMTWNDLECTWNG